MVCWGDAYEAAEGPPPDQFTALAAGNAHTCGIAVDDTLRCWGSAKHGRIEPPIGNYASIAAGWWHACALTAEGKAVCWGRND